MNRRIWFDRAFELGLPPDAYPEILERVRGTPARLEERTSLVPSAHRTVAPAHGWSIQSNVGHLLDLEPLWEGRLDDLLAGAPDLRPADLANRKTDDADHDSVPLDQLLSAFRTVRSRITSRLEALDGEMLARTALHPRLRQPMTVVDLFFFVAEHDDHHLATISALARSLAPRPPEGAS